MIALRHTLSRWRGVALLRAIYWRHIRRYYSEVCHDCGRPVRLVWTAPDPLWRAINGEYAVPKNPNPHGGIKCTTCFDRAFRRFWPGQSLRWVPMPLDAPVEFVKPLLPGEGVCICGKPVPCNPVAHYRAMEEMKNR